MVILGSFDSEFKFFCVSATLGLEVTNISRMAELLSSNLTPSCFLFFQREIFRFKKLSAYDSSADVLSD